MSPDRVAHVVHYLRGTGHAAPNHPYFKAISHNSSRTGISRSSQGDGGQETAQQARNELGDGSSAPIQSKPTSTARPGSTAWLVELVVAAVRPTSDLSTRQFASALLRTLTFGDRRWRDVNSALLERCEKGIADVDALLLNRQTEVVISPEDDANTAPAIATSWIGRKLSIQQRPFANGTSNTSFIIAPEDYEHDAPPTLVDAPLHCLFCIPKRGSLDVEDPYRMWILNASQCWEAISNHAPHPSLHPYVLKIRAFDKTPSWVLPESVNREERRFNKRSTSATIADPAVVHAPETRSTSAVKKTESVSPKGKRRGVLRFADADTDEEGRSVNAVAGPSRRL